VAGAVCAVLLVAVLAMVARGDAGPPNAGVYRLALILERKGDLAGAKKAAERSLELAAGVGDELRAEYTRLNTVLLRRLNKG
jgi:hypothetical protein